MMKLESLVEKNEQLMKSSVEASRWRTLCEEAEREHKKFSDRCLVLEKEVAALSNRLAATKQASEKQEEQFESQGKLWRSQVDKL